MNANPIATKLLIGPGTRLWFQPVEWLWILGPLPPNVAMAAEFASSTVGVIFVSNAGGVRWFLDRHRTVLALPLVVWMCYPTLGRPDFNRATLMPMLAGHGLHPVTEVALGASWTALRLRPIGAPAQPPGRIVHRERAIRESARAGGRRARQGLIA